MAWNKYSEEQRAFFRTYVPGHTYKEIAEEFTRRFPDVEMTVKKLQSYIKNHGLNTGHTGRFQKGHVPANKGKKGYWASGAEKGWYRKGHVPKNHLPVGSERQRTNKGRNRTDVYVKVAEPNKWVLKNRLVWEKAFGPIPKGKIVMFLNGDTTDCRIENLVCVDRKISTRINQLGLKSADPEVTRTFIAMAEVISKAGELKRRRKNVS